MDIYNRYGNGNNNNNESAYNSFVICASTGKAAVALGEATVHEALKLSRKSSNANSDGGLNPSELNTFRVAFRCVKCVITDEVSMLSVDQLNAADSRLRQITHRLAQPFGVLDMILCGYVRQLPPVRVTEIYKRCRNTHDFFGTTIEWPYLDYFPLVQVVRQAGTAFSGILTKIRDDEVHKFNTFVATQQRQENEYNVMCLQAQDTFLGCRTQHVLHSAKKVDKVSTSEFGNLPREILLVPGKPYMITANIDVIDGFVNRAVGTLKLCERREEAAAQAH
ncbi:uncharacterized protein LOC144175385 [Haemaphysalis longicornis]